MTPTADAWQGIQPLSHCRDSARRRQYRSGAKLRKKENCSEEFNGTLALGMTTEPSRPAPTTRKTFHQTFHQLQGTGVNLSPKQSLWTDEEIWQSVPRKQQKPLENKENQKIPEEGLEPSRPCGHWILNQTNHTTKTL